MMDAVEYLKTLCRMCNCECLKCEFGKARSGFETCPVWQRTHPEEAVEIAEKWPDARIKKADGLPMASPCDLDDKLADKCKGIPCPECRKKFWLAEVENAEAK